jgi:hypothetical protein
LATEKGTRKRKNIMVLLFFPALIFIFFMGWSMFLISNRKRSESEKPKAPKDDGVTILPAIFEETRQIANE